MIGAGIFVTPGLVAGHLPGAAWHLGAWILGGLIALSGAAMYGELGARLPRAGGDYLYLTAAFGPLWGFLTGWAAFALTFSAAAAAMSGVAVTYLQAALPGDLPQGEWFSAVAGPLLLLALVAANVAGARVSGRTTAVLTALPLLGLGGMFGYGLVAGGGPVGWPAHALAPPAGAWPVAFGAAMLPVFFTYSGWNAAAYLAGEMKEPGRNLPRGLLLGTGLVTLLYLAVNIVLLAAVPTATLAGSTTAGAEAARRLLGPAAERALACGVALAILGSANVTLMAGARIYYAMACDGLAPAALSRTNRAGVPHVALWAGGVWSAILAATGSVAQLISWATLAILLLSALGAAALFVLRRRAPRGSSFLCPGYPATPALYLAATLAVAVASCVDDPRQSIKGVLLVLAGLPIYAIVSRTRRTNGGSPTA
jgi:APA family basic amino acid/polyamine antiporter